jgi:protein transport protein DSL1/ZW10
VPKPAPIPVQLSIKETYVVSERTKDVLNIVESAVRESTALALSNPFAKVSFIGASDRSEQAESGALILQASAAALDLFRGLYAVKLATPKLAAGKAMRCSNDALYLSGEIERVLRVQAKGMPKPAKGKIEEAQERLKAIGEAWYNDALVRIQ